MKKILILILILLTLTGCVDINSSSNEKIINETVQSKTKVYNTYRKGYKFYLPNGLYVEATRDFNEVIKSSRETYYLYIDLISYLDGSTIESEKTENDIYYQAISKDNKTGYVRTKVYKNDKYLVEIAYNYAKIEVIVENERTKEAIANALVVLSSIKYNDSFLKSLSAESLLSYEEETVDIFRKTNDSNNNHLEWGATQGEEDTDTPPDTDLIN